MNSQEVFTKVVNHLRQQGKKATKLDHNGVARCVYRAPDGSKCAFGCLIEDDEFHIEMEGKTAYTILHRESLLARLEGHERLISCLQNVHDNRDFESWECCFSSIAEDFNLVVPEKIQ